MMVLDLPWPSSDLSPNKRLHWAQKARAVKKARGEAAWIATAAGLRETEAESVHISVTFTPPDRRHYDTDNLLARLKASFDGIADALGVDDRIFVHGQPRITDPRQLGNVRIEIEVQE